MEPECEASPGPAGRSFYFFGAAWHGYSQQPSGLRAGEHLTAQRRRGAFKDEAGDRRASWIKKSMT